MDKSQLSEVIFLLGIVTAAGCQADDDGVDIPTGGDDGDGSTSGDTSDAPTNTAVATSTGTAATQSGGGTSDGGSSGDSGGSDGPGEHAVCGPYADRLTECLMLSTEERDYYTWFCNSNLDIAQSYSEACLALLEEYIVCVSDLDCRTLADSHATEDACAHTMEGGEDVCATVDAGAVFATRNRRRSGATGDAGRLVLKRQPTAIKPGSD